MKHEVSLHLVCLTILFFPFNFEVMYRQVRHSERFNWAATQGVNEEALLENLPEDLQREIRRHLFKFVKKVSSRFCCNLLFWE